MNIYDFDKTIYDGDCSIDFFKYCILKNKKCLLILPGFFCAALLYVLKIYKKENLKSAFFKFFRYFNNIEQTAVDFWEYKKYKLKDFYLKQKNDTDIIISASPEFLIRPVAKKYNFKLLATKIDLKNGDIIGKNCHGQEKVKRLAEEMKINECKKFYSDSYSDTPLSKIAKEAYLVKGDKLLKWDK